MDTHSFHMRIEFRRAMVNQSIPINVTLLQRKITLFTRIHVDNNDL